MTMYANIECILDNFKATYPNDSFYVCKYKAPGGTSFYHGKKLLEIQLKDQDWLTVHKLVRSLGTNVNDNEVKQKALPIINDTIKITNYETRCDRICDNLKMIFPNHHVNVFIYGNDWQCAYHSKGKASFKKDYGSDVFIVLS
ncbi:unnamed protein product [Rotaria sordida]|uniref:Uncharacterized protein n=1 Tax=Rotaria sordida TaxID=392033 RepID=A0A814TT26_9BILA|nr:unnamed protein product [Rotaria sordida]CAF1164113.1 unnamed protein product [Rotaria sordida]